MIRRSRSPGRLPAPVAVLLASLWLAGCVNQDIRPGSDDIKPSEAYTRLGVAYLERGNIRRAMNALDRALAVNPDDAEALQAMAIVYQRQGEEDLADATFIKAIEADPDFTRTRNNYAAFLFARNRIREACEQLEQASRDTQYDNRAQLFANLGQCQRELGNPEAARESLARAQSIDPRSARSYLMLAELEFAQGDLERAAQQLESFMRLAGPNANALRLARDIARERGDLATASFYDDQLE